ncbi:MAG: TrmH family RNA methyltransferase [Bryobacteraceae bacterium]
MNSNVTLVGDSIENPANAVIMVHAAAMFGAACRFRDTKGLADAEAFAGSGLATITSAEVQALHSRIIACDNLPGAKEVYGFNPGRDFALLVGNERRGLSHEFTTLATDRVQIPMHSRRINCLNVSAASAVALYYLCGSRTGPMAIRNDPGSRRPDILLCEPSDHFELGSTIRSAAGLGWKRAFIEDRHQVWFGCGRAVRSEGRAAARRGKNEILLIPCPPQATYAYPRVTVITRQKIGVPLDRINLAGGPGQLVVIPDESRGDFALAGAARLGRKVEVAHLQLPAAEYTYHYRLMATVALAEASRQVGRRPAVKAPPAMRPPIYDDALKQLAKVAGETVPLEDLLNY